MQPSAPSDTHREAEPSEFTQALHFAHRQHDELEQRYAAALAEIEALRSEVQRLQAGRGIEVIIDGKRYPLQTGLAPLPTPETANGNGHQKSLLADSFVL